MMKRQKSKGWWLLPALAMLATFNAFGDDWKKGKIKLGESYYYEINKNGSDAELIVTLPGNFDVTNLDARNRVGSSAVVDYISREILLTNTNRFITNLAKQRDNVSTDKADVINFLAMTYRQMSKQKATIGQSLKLNIKESDVLPIKETVKRDTVICIDPFGLGWCEEELPLYEVTIRVPRLNSVIRVRGIEILRDIAKYDNMHATAEMLRGVFGNATATDFQSNFAQDVDKFVNTYAKGSKQKIRISHNDYLMACENLSNSKSSCETWLKSINDKVRKNLIDIIVDSYGPVDDAMFTLPKRVIPNIQADRFEVNFTKLDSEIFFNEEFLQEVARNGLLFISTDDPSFKLKAKLLGGVSDTGSAHEAKFQLESPVECRFDENTNSAALSTSFTLRFNSSGLQQETIDRVNPGNYRFMSDPCITAFEGMNNEYEITSTFIGNINSYTDSGAFKRAIFRVEPDSSGSGEVLVATGDQGLIPVINFGSEPDDAVYTVITASLTPSNISNSQCEYESLNMSRLSNRTYEGLNSIVSELVSKNSSYLDEVDREGYRSNLLTLTQGEDVEWKKEGTAVCNRQKVIQYDALAGVGFIFVRATNLDDNSVTYAAAVGQSMLRRGSTLDGSFDLGSEIVTDVE